MRGLGVDTRISSRFELLSPLGRGGFGSVYEALDSETGQHVALKELGHASGDNLSRFKQEFRVLSGMHHPNLVGLKELFEQDGRWFIVMELITGCDFISYVQPHAEEAKERCFDETRLRGALAGTAQGLCALHEFGVLHRDLKPSNISVTAEGRAVLLDFGLITSVDPQRQSTRGAGAGTVAYMAPEQAAGTKIGPAADWYALGVCLFEAVTGRLPFEGATGLQLLLQKQQIAAPRASMLAHAVPPDLDDLCARLLERDPEDRPRASDVNTALGIRAAPRAESSARSLARNSLPSNETGSAFAGREVELQHLERALSRTHEGEFRLVLVEGESGVGKSELVSEFVRGVSMRYAALLTFAGRCYENEQLPYKAFDGCVDALAKYLRRLNGAESQNVLPAHAALLGQLFPVLKNLPGIARAKSDQLPADPTTRRLEAFAALSALLRKLAEDRPVILTIDDLQWADAESFRLLKAVVEQRERPPILIIATVRPREELDANVLAQLERVRAWPCTDVQPLHGLPHMQAAALAARLLGGEGNPAWIRSIAEESRGHPLFLSELVHFAQSREMGAGTVITLDAALRARIERLSREGRELLELVALAARPCASQVFARALGTLEVERTATPLLQAKLLRLRKGRELGCFHDRIRHVAVALIAKSRLPYLHRQLALSLSEQAEADPSEQARHWDLAGESERAALAYEQAASGAIQALAFTRAAELCARALELLSETRDERYMGLLTQRAHALACAGRSAHAADLYGRAADLASGETRIRLQASVANQLMLSAQMAPGLLAAKQVFEQLGVALPLTGGAALLRIIWERLRFALAGESSRLSGAEASKRRLAVELIVGIHRSLILVDPRAYFAVSAQYMRIAASLGDPAQLAGAYSMRGYLITQLGSLKKGMPFFERAKGIAAGLNQPRLNASVIMREGSARLIGWDIEGSEVCLLRAHELLQVHCPDQPRELTMARFQLGTVWFILGKHERLAAEVDSWIAQARERGDGMGVSLLVGMAYGFLRHLMRDAPDDAIKELEQANAQIPSEPFGLTQLGHLMGVQVALFYRGGASALQWLAGRQEEHARPYLLKTPFGREIFLICSVNATLHACLGADDRELKRLLKRARKQAQSLGRRGVGLGHAFAELALAQMDAVEGRLESARARLRELRKHAGGAETTLGQQSLYVEGLLDQSEGGSEKCAAARAFFQKQGWKRPERALSVYLPLLPRLAREGSAKAQRPLLRDRYQVLGQLGSGGFGNVVEARDTHTGSRVALKELVSGGGKPLERFKREFRALHSVHHPNLVRLHALFEDDSVWYIAMELLEGLDLIAYVREGGDCDKTRLRTTFAGIGQGLAALHDAGFAHRDLTRSNVLVTRDGRPVLFDFGLLGALGEAHDAAPLGTADYAAPEQLHGATPHASADIYALGMCLYEALTGELPFRGDNPAEVVQQKARGALSAHDTDASSELALCLRMLEPEPSRRPTLDEIRGFFAFADEKSARVHSLRPAPSEAGLKPAFWGRAQELAQLNAALERASSGGLSSLVLRGESGLGKSALIAEFRTRVQAEQSDVMLLQSRCYENEQVSLKAFDGAVDQLAQVLRRMAQAECQQLLPRRAGLLAQLFPVLATVPAIAAAGKKGIPADPAARKLAAYACFTQLLARLSERFVLVFIIDDLQWADAESFRMLDQLREQTPEARLLFVCTARPEIELSPQMSREIEAWSALPLTETIQLAGLSDGEARELASYLMNEDVPADLLQKLVTESRGHPLFLHELVQRAKGGAISQVALSLDDALRARIERLDGDARALLDLLALAGRPYRTRWLSRALGAEVLPHAALTSLLMQGLIRTRSDDELTCYHDRIRQVAVGLLAASKQQRLAAKLAEALESDSLADAAERARLWDFAGDHERAVVAYEGAGDRALDGFSFARAEEYYARALVLLGARRDETFVRITMQRGHALVRTGTSAEAARGFQAAAEFAAPELQLRLQIWAAQHLVLSAQVDEGVQAAGRVLGELGIPLAKSDKQALLRIGVERALIGLRGTKLRARHTTPSRHERLVLETLHGLSGPVRNAAYLPGSLLVMQYLRRALHAGDPAHAARALAYEALWRAVNSPIAIKGTLFEQSRELADSVGEPTLIAEVEVMRGLAHVASCDFARGSFHLTFAHELIQSRCPGQPWLLTAARTYLGQAYMNLGEYRTMASSADAWLSEARAKQDRYAFASLTGFGGCSFRYLLRGEPDAAIAEIQEAMAPWPERSYTTSHFGADLMVRAFALGYKGDSLLLEWMNGSEPRWRDAFLLKTPTCRATRLFAYALGLLFAYQSEPAQHSLLERARLTARQLAKVRTAIAPGMVELCWSSIRAIERRDDEALAHARAAQQLLAGSRFAMSGKYLEGTIEGGESGKQKRDEVRAFMKAQGAHDPDRIICTVVPGLSLLAESR